MIEETGVVVGIEGRTAFVQAERQGACGACAANKACGTGQLSTVLGRRSTVIRAINRAGAKTGERVVVGIDERAVMRSSAAVYLVPVVALVLGAGLGTWLGRQFGLAGDLPAVVLGIAGLALGFGWLRQFSRRIGADPRYQPVVLRALGTAPIPIHPVTTCNPLG